MGNHSALLTMTMMIIAVGIVQHVLVEGGGLLPAITVSLLVPILLGGHMISSCGMMEDPQIFIFHM